MPLQGRTSLDLQHTDLCFDNCSPDHLQCRVRNLFKLYFKTFLQIFFKASPKRRRRQFVFLKKLNLFNFFKYVLSRQKFSYFSICLSQDLMAWGSMLNEQAVGSLTYPKQEKSNTGVYPKNVYLIGHYDLFDQTFLIC